MSRIDFDDACIQKLAENLRSFGQRNPIGLRQVNEKLQLIYGWNRIKAALLLSWETIDARVYGEITNLQAQFHNISDNLTREDLSKLEVAYQVKKLREEHNIPVREITKFYGDKRQYIYDLISLTQMKKELQQAVHRGKIGLTHAIEINKFPPSIQLDVLAETINEGLSTSKLKRMRGSSLNSMVVTKASSQFSETEREEVAIKSEYRRFKKFLLDQIDPKATSLDDREEIATDWISSLDGLKRAFGWKLPEITKKVNTLMFTVLRARLHLEEESDVSRAPSEHLTNRDMLRVTGLRRDMPSRNLLGWFLRESARFQALSCNHHWRQDEKSGDSCRLCGISRDAKLHWEDPPYEPPSTQGETEL